MVKEGTDVDDRTVLVIDLKEIGIITRKWNNSGKDSE